MERKRKAHRMIAPRTLNPEMLQELGTVIIMHNGLDELITNMAAALLNRRDRGAADNCGWLALAPLQPLSTYSPSQHNSSDGKNQASSGALV
jgi:hypothetical protein